MHKTQVIILCGRAQSGKSTACEFIKNRMDFFDKLTGIYSFADPLKEVCEFIFQIPHQQLYGSNEDKNTLTHIKWADLPFSSFTTDKLYNQITGNKGLPPMDSCLTSRQFLQVFGTNICRKIYGDCWARATYNKIARDQLSFALIADCRFPNEIDVFTESYNENVEVNPIIIKLERNPLDLTHESETALDNYNWSKVKHFIEIKNVNLTEEQKNTEIWNEINKILNGAHN